MATAVAIRDALRTALESSPAVKELTVDGIKIKRVDLEELRYWEREAAREEMKHTGVAQINLSNF